MQKGFKAQKTAGRFEGPEECRKNLGLRRTQLGLRAQKITERSEGSGDCRKV